jgi:hypothetical protein
MADDKNTAAIRYRYKFQFANGTEKDFEINLNAQTLELIANKDLPKPEWTKLKFCQCSNCPLDERVEYCPVAVNLSHLVETFKDSISFESTLVTVETSKRTYHAQVTLQEGLSAILGIYMVTSNCPVMDKLRPNVRFHLPFASEEETIYRAVSMYLTAQYFLMRKGEQPDWELKKLAEIYKAVSHVNVGISERISQASHKDANVNAVIILSTFGETLENFLEESLKEIQHLFSEYTKPGG